MERVFAGISLIRYIYIIFLHLVNNMLITTWTMKYKTMSWTLNICESSSARNFFYPSTFSYIRENFGKTHENFSFPILICMLAFRWVSERASICVVRSGRRRNGVVCHDLKIISITLAFSSAEYLVATNRATKVKDFLRPNISARTQSRT